MRASLGAMTCPMESTTASFTVTGSGTSPIVWMPFASLTSTLASPASTYSLRSFSFLNHQSETARCYSPAIASVCMRVQREALR